MFSIDGKEDMDIVETTRVSESGATFGDRLPALADRGTTDTWYVPLTGECSLGLYDCDAATAERARAHKLAEFREYARRHGMSPC